MKIWGLRFSGGPHFWTTNGQQVALVDYGDNRCEWRRVSDNRLLDYPDIREYHKEMLIPKDMWPVWALVIADAYIDEGI